MQTLAAVAAALPWDGYRHVLMGMLTTAKDEQALRSSMLKAVTRLLDAFGFLPRCETIDDLEDAPAAVLSGVQRRVLQNVRKTLLPALMQFIVAPAKKRGVGAALASGNDPVAAVLGKANVSSSLNRSAPAVQVQIAVAIVKLLRFIPGGFDAHVEPLLTEIILRLRTKRDDIREGARTILCGTMKEVGPRRLQFLFNRLRDNFIHGYQLHVLSYSIVAVLQAMKPQFLEDAARSTAIARAEAEAKKQRPPREASPAPQAPAPQPKFAKRGKRPGAPQGPAAGAARPQPTDGVSKRETMTHWVIGQQYVRKPYLDQCMPDLLSLFLDDTLGEMAELKQQTELVSTMVEMKKSRGLAGCGFLAEVCIASSVLSAFAGHFRRVLTPNSIRQIAANNMLTTNPVAAQQMRSKTVRVDREFPDQLPPDRGTSSAAASTWTRRPRRPSCSTSPRRSSRATTACGRRRSASSKRRMGCAACAGTSRSSRHRSASRSSSSWRRRSRSNRARSASIWTL